VSNDLQRKGFGRGAAQISAAVRTLDWREWDDLSDIVGNLRTGIRARDLPNIKKTAGLSRSLISDTYLLTPQS
jgi:hypothetical protein